MSRQQEKSESQVTGSLVESASDYLSESSLLSSSYYVSSPEAVAPSYPLSAEIELIETQLLSLQAQGVEAIVVWVAEADKALVPELQRLCRQYQIRLSGAVFPALIYQAQFVSRGCLISPLPKNTRSLLLSCVEDSHYAHNVVRLQQEVDTFPVSELLNLMLVFDAQLSNISEMLDLIYLGLHNSVRYLGANAGSETFQPMPCVFDQDVWVGDAMLALLIASEHKGALAHGYEISTLVTATSTERNRIQSIEWRNAFEVYQALVSKEFGPVINQDNFYDYAVHFPFGIMRISGQPLVRIPVALESDGTLVCVGDIAENTVLTLLQGVDPDCDETLALLAQQSGVSSPIYQVFYCAGRKMHLGDKSSAELTRLASLFAPSQLSGAVSLGEISNDDGQGYPLFHNAAIMCCPWV